MPYFEIAIGLLFVLALVDLSVGVSNDAVNFLNSAIGSRVATRRVILIIAGLGVLAGSVFSSGIMEVARRGIFNPEMFVFADVMVIFLAVMLADVLLLDLFNTFALPTSTTVSIVFELLGASVAVALFAVGGDLGGALAYVNVERAIVIISGIGLSVIIAFVVGTVVQFFSRALFTFQQENRTRVIQIGWCAIAFTAIAYFLLVKGLKGASFISDDVLVFVYANTVSLVLATLLISVLAMSILDRLGVNLLATVVLGGTFSLALAFASNDLVNFIGVPLAGLSSWQAWSISGLPAETMTMEALTEPVRGNTLILVGAGAVMVTTLWLSSKARSVTQTEVNLGRQDDAVERFRPGPFSRGVVRTFVSTGEAAAAVIPQQWRTGIAERFAREKVRSFDLSQPAFDTLRASVNLTVASILIVFATSLKLPLSTTFVSFMVAMGTSLADRAWGRDVAVYRVAGVLSVIGGWLITAFAAFAMAAAFASFIKLVGAPGVAVLALCAAAALVHMHRYHARRVEIQQQVQSFGVENLTEKETLTLRGHFLDTLERNAEVLDRVVRVLLKRNRKAAKKLHAALRAGQQATRAAEAEFVRKLDRVQPGVEPWLLNQFDVLAFERDLLQSATTLAELAGEHVLNEHTPPTGAVTDSLRRLRGLFGNAFDELIRRPDSTGKGSSIPVLRGVDEELDRLTSLLLDDLYSGERSTRNTTLMLGIVLEMRDLKRELERASAW